MRRLGMLLATTCTVSWLLARVRDTAHFEHVCVLLGYVGGESLRTKRSTKQAPAEMYVFVAPILAFAQMQVSTCNTLV
jgi:hypothetical protein